MSYAATINNRMRGALTSDSQTAKVIRSSGLAVIGYGFAQTLRLASNLLLIPEASGLIALVILAISAIWWNWAAIAALASV